jgi:hypothetical protein
MNDVTAAAPSPKILEQLLITGDLSSLSASERLDYYKRVCDSLGLNYLTQPFSYIKLNGKLVLYAKRDCSEQLRKLHGVSVENMHHELLPDELYRVTADFIDKTGRRDQASGIVSLKGLSGEPRANKMLGCETKCKRRGTLSICGMGMLDETEVASIPDAEAEAAEKFKPLTPYNPPLVPPVIGAAFPDDPSPPSPPGDGEPQEEETLSLDFLVPPPAAPTITPARKRALEAAIGELEETFGRSAGEYRRRIKERMAEEFDVKHFLDLNLEQYEQVMGWINKGWQVLRRDFPEHRTPGAFDPDVPAHLVGALADKLNKDRKKP